MTNLHLSLLEAARSHYVAEVSKANAILNVYLNNSVGIGEHSDIVSEVISTINAITGSQGSLFYCEKMIGSLLKDTTDLNSAKKTEDVSDTEEGS